PRPRTRTRHRQEIHGDHPHLEARMRRRAPRMTWFATGNGRNDMTRLKLCAGVAALGLLFAGTAQADPLNIVFTVHSAASNTFWQAVKKGYDDACGKIQANCQMLFTQTEGSIAEQQANMQTALAAKPDALITSIVDNKAFDELIKGARDKGIIVIGSNVDDTEGAKGNARQSFIGQGFIPAGYTLGQALSAHFPKDGPIRVLVGVSAPGQNWSEQRAQGVINFLDDYKKQNASRDIKYEKMDS